MDWNLIRTYLMVAEFGSASLAAKHLEVTQSTISRHLAELEKQLSVQLFDRRKTGLVLTEKGCELLNFAQQMRCVAEDLQSQAAQFSNTVSGSVRISAGEIIAVEVLPHCLGKILAENPELQIDIVSTNDASNLLSREADIALRMFPPQQQDLISRHLLDVQLSFYAHESYIEKQGLPKSIQAFSEHHLIGFDVSKLFIDGAKQLGVKLSRESFKLRSDSIKVQEACALAGLGMLCMQDELARRMPGMRKIDTGFVLPALPLYLVAQQELRASRKLRVVFDGLATAIQDFYEPGTSE